MKRPREYPIRILRRIESKLEALAVEVKEIKSALFPGKVIPNHPTNEAVGVSTTETSLSWWFQPTDETPEVPSYNVYLDTAGATTFLGSTPSSFWPPDDQELVLSPDTVYYWRVDAVGALGVTTGDVWTFTTGK